MPDLQTPGPGLLIGDSCTRSLVLWGVVLAISLLAISHQSLWIDEALTAVKARQATLERWWQAMAQEKASDLQMPLYMLYVWGYEKVFGASEWALRAANLPWFVAGVAAFTVVFPPGDRRRLIAAGLTVGSPFAWYCLDEARPYAMQLGASLMVVGALGHLVRSGAWRPAPTATARPCETWPTALFGFALFVLSGSSLLGMVWAGAGLVALVVLLPRSRLLTLLRQQRRLWLAAGVGLLAFGAYYLWTLRVGARASATATTGWRNTGFIGYELLGFSGLGPGRLELRSSSLRAFDPFWAGLTLHGLTTAILFGAAVRDWFKSGSARLGVAILACSVPTAFILGTGWMAHFRVLGRHFTPCLPALLLVLVTGWAALWRSGRTWARLVLLLYCASTVWSCLALRTAPRHLKDDYRAAAAVARAALAEGRAVWWNAAEAGAQYYRLPANAESPTGRAALLLFNPPSVALERLPLPDLVIVSKPDLYDRHGAVGGYVRERGFQATKILPAFTVWERKAE